MRRASVLVFLSLALLAPSGSHAAPKKEPPACAGRDIFIEMKRSDPEGYARIRAAADAVPNTRALLWRIDRQGRPSSYLFGTIHSTDARVQELSPAVVAAFHAANTVALEYRESAPGQGMNALVALIAAKGRYESGNGLKDALTPAEIDALRKTLAAEGVPADATHLLRPWLAVSMLAIPHCEKRRANAGLLTLDQRIERDAMAQGKRVVGLETAAFQLDALVGMQEAVQIGLLKATVVTIPHRQDALETLHQAYLARDLATSVPLSKYLVERAGADPSPLDALERDIGTKRNYGVRDASLQLLERGGAFIAAGGLHLSGQEGLVELFRAAGFTVTPIE